jgi:hypothetical protein
MAGDGHARLQRLILKINFEVRVARARRINKSAAHQPDSGAQT